MGKEVIAQRVMDRLSGNRMQRGASPAQHVVKGGLDTLVRESGQNSLDQPLDPPKKPIRVRYSLLELTGDRKKKFLEAMDWQILRRHLEATTKDPGPIALRLRRGISALDSAGPL